MNADSIFYIGSDHDICEDYAVAGMRGDLAYAIVSDGCSASPDVDIGARIMASAAREVLLNQVYSPLSFLRDEAVTETQFGDWTIKLAQKILLMTPSVNPQALNATTLIAWVKDNLLTAYLFGDGVIVHKNKDRVMAHHVHLTSGAPDYLAYWLNKADKAAYDSMSDNTKEIEYRINGEIHQGGKFNYTPFTPLKIISPVEAGDTIAVISDGINSFRKQDGSFIPWQEVLPNYIEFKGLGGEFVFRRIRAFKRKCHEEGIVHLDDISIAAITI